MSIKVKSFGVEIQPLKTTRELAQLDEEINNFITSSDIRKVISVSDTTTADDKGATIGLIRVLTYELHEDHKQKKHHP